jgi:hypothetical protein
VFVGGLGCTLHAQGSRGGFFGVLVLFLVLHAILSASHAYLRRKKMCFEIEHLMMVWGDFIIVIRN